MSSDRRSRLLDNTIVRHVFWATVFSIVVILTATWSYYAIARYLVIEDQRVQIRQEFENISAVYVRSGLNAAVELIDQENAKFVQMEAQDSLGVFDPIFLSLTDTNDEPVAGIHGLTAKTGWSTTRLITSEITDQPLNSLSETLPGARHRLTVAKPVPWSVIFWDEVMQIGVIWLLLGVVPTSLLVGFVLNRAVSNRLEHLGDVIEAYEPGVTGKRAHVSGTDSMFDRLSTRANLMFERFDTNARMVDDITCDIAHDLKTPLTNISGRLQLIKRDAEHSDAIEEHVVSAHDHLEALVRTLDATLRLGQLDSGARTAAFVTVNLAQLVSEMAETYAPVLEDADKRFVRDIGDEIYVEGDKQLLGQMIINLFENALRHTRDGAEVWIRLVSLDGIADIEFGDDGPGLSRSQAKRIFARFEKANHARLAPGTGLGLNLVEAIAKLHGGQATVRGYHPGLVISVSLPTTDAPNP